MIKLLKKLPREVIIACSGGVDSMALFNFLSKKHDVTVAFFHHGTETSSMALQFLNHALPEKTTIIVGTLSAERAPGQSPQEHWRDERYKFLTSLNGVVVTAHHLNDVAETWLWSSCHGTPKLIPCQHKNVMRPILTTPKQTLIDYCLSGEYKWIEDKSNVDTRYARNLVRHELMPSVLKVNPGLMKMLERKILLREKSSAPVV